VARGHQFKFEQTVEVLPIFNRCLKNIVLLLSTRSSEALRSDQKLAVAPKLQKDAENPRALLIFFGARLVVELIPVIKNTGQNIFGKLHQTHPQIPQFGRNPNSNGLLAACVIPLLALPVRQHPCRMQI